MVKKLSRYDKATPADEDKYRERSLRKEVRKAAKPRVTKADRAPRALGPSRKSRIRSIRRLLEHIEQQGRVDETKRAALLEKLRALEGPVAAEGAGDEGAGAAAGDER